MFCPHLQLSTVGAAVLMLASLRLHQQADSLPLFVLVVALAAYKKLAMQWHPVSEDPRYSWGSLYS